MARSCEFNVLWLVGGTPLWIDFGGAAVGWIDYLFYYHLPFLHAIRGRTQNFLNAGSDDGESAAGMN